MGKPSREKERPLKLPPISGVGKNRISYVDESLNLTDAQFKAFQEAFELFDKVSHLFMPYSTPYT